MIKMNDEASVINWRPDKEDIRKICEAITCNWIAENPSNGADYCIHCLYEYGNIKKWFFDKDKKPPHHKDCPYPIAEDVLTGIDS